MKIAAVGLSTGGVDIVTHLVTSLKRVDGVLIICLHMQEDFLKDYVDKLQQKSSLPLLLVDKSMQLKRGSIYICCKGATIYRNGTLEPIERATSFSPSIDMMFSSLSHSKDEVLGVILTGIGDDGAKGVEELLKANKEAIASRKKDSVVFGMPRRAIERGAKEMGLNEIYDTIERFLS